jgi:hypothetical protein
MKILTLLALFALSTSAFAQETNSQTRIWGKVSAVSAAMSGDSDFISARTGLNLGAEIELPVINQNFAIQTGVNYTQYGVTSLDSFSINSFRLDFDGTVALNYIQIPVLFKVKSGPIAIFAGPFAGLAVTRTYKFTAVATSGGTPTPVSQTGDLNSYTKSFDFGARFGVAYEPVILNAFTLSFGITRDYSFTRLNNDGDALMNRAFLFTAGLGFHI